MIIVNPEKRRDGKSSFTSLIKYIESGDKGETKLLYSGYRGIAAPPRNLDDLIKDFNANAAKNMRCKDPVFHAILSWKEGEIPTEQQVQEAIEIYMQETGMEKCHCYYGAHKNTKNIHVHLCLSKIDPETKRSIIPAEGWTKKANTRAARMIEIAQGWEKDPGGMYQVIGGDIMEIVTDTKEKALGKRAQDFENITSEKSAIRYAKERCTDALFESESWQELHARLAESGVRLERKGSGCVLFVGETAIKLSSVSQQLSLSKLENRMGAYQERTADTSVAEYRTEPLRKTSNSEKYIAERKAYYDEKNAAKAELERTFKDELETLKNQQKEEREQLHASRKSWKGQGALLNALKSRMAWEHVQQKESLIDSRRIRRAHQRDTYGSRFPRFTDWLKSQGKEQEANLWRYKETLPMAVTAPDNSEVKPAREDAKNAPQYVADMERWGRTDSFVYRMKEKGRKIAFVDTGRRIDIVNWRDEKAILDALKLAQQKWGKCTVHGSAAYKAMCVAVAAKHNINLKNADLQPALQKEKERLRTSQKISPQKEGEGMSLSIMKSFEQYHAAVAADRYRVTAFWQDERGQRRAWVLDKQNGEVSRGFEPQEIVQKIGLIKKLDEQKKHVYYTPISDNKHHILIDDMTKESLAKLQADGYAPAVILESSPGNFQAILTIPKIGAEFDKEVSNALMIELNTKYGDPKIQGAIHPHRIPGTHNVKEKHLREDGSYPEVKLIHAEPQECRKAYGESYDMYKSFTEAKRRDVERMRRETETKQQTEERKLLSPVEAYNAHAKNIFQHAGAGGIQNWNRVDSMIAVRMHVTGYSKSEIQKAIKIGAPSMRPESERNKHKWEDYAKRTAEFPETLRGQQQVREYGSRYRDHWLRIEGRLPERQRKDKEIER